MKKRDGIPPVAKTTGPRRVIELLKDLLIILLTCSAILLAWQTPLVTHLRGWVAPSVPSAPPESRQSGGAVAPYAICARNELGLYGVSYDDTLVGRTFERFSPLLGEALTTAGDARRVTWSAFRALLEAPGVYCALQGEVPLSAISALLGGQGAPEGNASALVLSWDGSRVYLGWQSGDLYYEAATQVAYQGRLEEALAEFSPNGAAFAYALAETDPVYEILDPRVLASMAAPQPLVYSAAFPDLTGDSAALEQLLADLGFLSGVDAAYGTPGGLAITESGDRLQVSSAGAVTFRAGEETRFPVSSATDHPTAAEAARSAWDLLDRAVHNWEGTGSFVLTGLTPTDDGWTVTFHSRLAGIPVLTGENGWSARFVIEGRKISDFTLYLRLYTATEEISVVPSDRLAAAAMASLPGSGGELTLCYSDNLGATVSAGWRAGE